MKTTHQTSALTGADAQASVARYQIYRQNRAGHFLPGYRTDSAPEAVEAFLHQSPVFEGGGVRLLDHHDRRMVASVEWRTEKTGFGFPVHHRTNRFHDAMIEQLAGEVLARETLREPVRHSLLTGI
ncbi:MAG: hypothetical protein JF599_01825 [Verrucomicrobia bacterium]|nr:hypothetical protein [Verrucomicrobiota bacterium]